MPLPVPNLDDRRFDDLVAEAKDRLSNHLPELTQIAPGDPANAFVDLFAFLTETILYRSNLIPERQRRIFLNLLQIPIRPAKPAMGVACIDASGYSANLPNTVYSGTQLDGSVKHRFTTLSEVQPTPLTMVVMSKEKVNAKQLLAMGMTLEELKQQYGLSAKQTPVPFQPKHHQIPQQHLTLSGTIDHFYYLALLAPKTLKDQITPLRENLAGTVVNFAISPNDGVPSDQLNELSPRKLNWELVTVNELNQTLFIPLTQISDSSNGGRKTGVVRLKLPSNAQLFERINDPDPMFSGLADYPPELPSDMDTSLLVAWVRLSCDDDPNLELSYLGINGVDVIAQGLAKDRMLGKGNGRPSQSLQLEHTDIDPGSMMLEVEHNSQWQPWYQVDYLAGYSQEDLIYKLDASTGTILFGNGLDSGKRPPVAMRIRAASYRYGGGSESNIQAEQLTEIVDGSDRLKLRQEFPFTGGRDAETVVEAEKRIPQYLSHRNRAVTAEDYQVLVEFNPVNPVAKATVVKGLIPGNKIEALRENVPGVVSLFVMPPQPVPTVDQYPKPAQGLLKDVFQYLVPRVPVGTELYILSPEFIPFAATISVEVMDSDTEIETLNQVEKTLIEFVWPLAPGGFHDNGWIMGENLNPNDLLTQVARVPGVRSVNRVSLFVPTNTPGQWRALKPGESIVLSKYQLPELKAVMAVKGQTQANALPQGLIATPSTPDQGVPAPVIPEVC